MGVIVIAKCQNIPTEQEIKDELKRLNVKIERLRSEKNRGDELRAKRDTFAEITPEQKDLIEE